MACLKCPMVTLAEMRPHLADVHRFTTLLCPEHFREARASEQTRIARTLREVSRIFCPAFCGNEMYLLRPGPCERCRLGMGPLSVPDAPQDIAPIVSDAPARMTKAARGRCYAAGCPLPGQLYAGGSWCGVAHHPPRPAWLP